MNKLMDRIYKWWNGLIEYKQFWLMMDWYPNEFKGDDCADKFFGDMPDEYKLWIYNNESI